MKELTFDLTQFISKGLRPEEDAVLNQPYCEVLTGAYPEGGKLEFDLDLTQLSISGITGSPTWPYPQIFSLPAALIACTETAIWERLSSVWTSKISGLTAGIPWTMADFGQFIAFTNGKQTVVRQYNGVYAVSSTIPVGTSICGTHGQIIVSASGSVVPHKNIDYIGQKVTADALTLTGTLAGAKS